MRRRVVVGAAVAALTVAGTATAASAPPTAVPGQLTVGLFMPSEGFQTGAVVGNDVVYARGLEIELSRQLRARLGIPAVRFKQAAAFGDLFSEGGKPWDLAVAQISIVAARRRTADFSVPYLTADQGVLVSRQLVATPRSLADLRGLRLCVLTGSTGAAVVRARVRPRKPARTYKMVQNLMQSLQTGLCDAVVYDAPSLATLRNRVPNRYGSFAGLIRTRETYGIAMPKGSPLLAPVNAALKAMIADGAITALERRWLTVDLAKLRVLT